MGAVLAAAMGMSAASAVAQERFFAGVYVGESSSDFDRSGRAAAQMPALRPGRIIDGTTAWGIRGGVDQHTARYYLTYNYASDNDRQLASLREQTLSGSYDLAFPLSDSTRIFGGASAGLTYLKQNTRNFANDSDWGVHAGLQAGVLQELGHAVELEVGFRYTLHDRVKVNFVEDDTSIHRGRLTLDDSQQWYIGANWHF